MKLKKITADLLIPLNALLLFFVLFETRMVIPSWLKVFARMHPLALHFPIVIALIYVGMVLFIPVRLNNEKWYRSMLDSLLLTAAFTASLTSLMGMLLSKDGGYEPDAIALHKWMGVLLPLALFFLYRYRTLLLRNVFIARLASVSMTVIIVLTGHQGAVITHGENFIMAPVNPEKTRLLPVFEEAVVYTDLVQPILESKCVSCHNRKKGKGDLILETKESLLKGGKDGKLWDTSKADMGLMMNRINLPLNKKKHMPPIGKPQLTDQETIILAEWIKGGAGFEERVNELKPSDTLYVLAKNILPSSAEQEYNFPAASHKQIQQLNNNNRVITPVAQGSPALSVSFYNPTWFNEDAIKELGSIGPQIVELNLMNMPVDDDELKHIKAFLNLRKLNLNFTKITGKSLKELQSLPVLQYLSLTGTSVEYSHLRVFQAFPQLHTVHLWNTTVSAKDVSELKKQNKKISFLTGFNGDTIILKLTPPVLLTEEDVIDSHLTVSMKHNVKGTVIRYTKDGKDPDSVSSQVFTDSLVFNSNVTIKAKAFKPGWISSDVFQKHFFKGTYHPDTVMMLSVPDNRYAGTGARTLYDREKSDINYTSGKWIGFKENKLDAVMMFDEPVVASNVTVSILKDLSATIFPPAKVEIWGGNRSDMLKLLRTVIPPQPIDMEYRACLAVECNFNPVSLRYIKVIAYPVSKIPGWHQAKGNKAYVFTDEVFIN